MFSIDDITSRPTTLLELFINRHSFVQSLCRLPLMCVIRCYFIGDMKQANTNTSYNVQSSNEHEGQQLLVDFCIRSFHNHTKSRAISLQLIGQRKRTF